MNGWLRRRILLLTRFTLVHSYALLLAPPRVQLVGVTPSLLCKELSRNYHDQYRYIYGHVRQPPRSFHLRTSSGEVGDNWKIRYQVSIWFPFLSSKFGKSFVRSVIFRSFRNSGPSIQCFLSLLGARQAWSLTSYDIERQQSGSILMDFLLLGPMTLTFFRIFFFSLISELSAQSFAMCLMIYVVDSSTSSRWINGKKNNTLLGLQVFIQLSNFFLSFGLWVSFFHFPCFQDTGWIGITKSGLLFLACRHCSIITILSPNLYFLRNIGIVYWRVYHPLRSTFPFRSVLLVPHICDGLIWWTNHRATVSQFSGVPFHHRLGDELIYDDYDAIGTFSM